MFAKQLFNKNQHFYQMLTKNLNARKLTQVSLFTISSYTFYKFFQPYHLDESLRINKEVFISELSGKINLHYQPIKTLGKGNYGTVELVRNRHNNQLRAIKTVSKKVVPPNELAKIVDEINIQKSCDHPNILKIYEVHEDTDNYYFTLEYCEKGTLIDHIKSLGNNCDLNMMTNYIQ